MRVLRDVEGVGICELTNADVVRHMMVQRIVEAYEKYEKSRNGGQEESRRNNGYENARNGGKARK